MESKYKLGQYLKLYYKTPSGTVTTDCIARITEIETRELDFIVRYIVVKGHDTGNHSFLTGSIFATNSITILGTNKKVIEILYG